MSPHPSVFSAIRQELYDWRLWTGRGIVLAFVESGTVRVANVTAEGIAQPSVFAKTAVTQHRPYLSPGRQAGEWFVAWLDMENMHLEPYVAKLHCPR